MKKALSFALICILCWSTVACNTNQILDDILVALQIASSIGQAVGAVSPTDSAIIMNVSATATAGVTLVQNAYAAYEKSGAASDLDKAKTACAIARANLQNALGALHIVNPKSQAKVNAWANLVLSSLTTVLDALPAAAGPSGTVAVRTLKPLPLTAKQLQARWVTEVCEGDAACGALVKVPRHGLF